MNVFFMVVGCYVISRVSSDIRFIHLVVTSLRLQRAVSFCFTVRSRHHVQLRAAVEALLHGLKQGTQSFSTWTLPLGKAVHGATFEQKRVFSRFPESLPALWPSPSNIHIAFWHLTDSSWLFACVFRQCWCFNVYVVKKREKNVTLPAVCGPLFQYSLGQHSFDNCLNK